MQSPVHGGGRTFSYLESNEPFGYVPPSPFTNHDYGYNPDTLSKHHRYETSADDDVLDIALQIGRLSITEKLGGYFSPHIASQVSIVPSCRCLGTVY